jgi:choline dehydrogenase-like flavoprotein
MSTNHYDVIIIGSGAGGGTLALKLAPSGKRILILERGDYLPREKPNWDATEVFVKNRYVSKDTWFDKDEKPFQPGVHHFVGGATKMFGAALFRLRKEDFTAHRTADGECAVWHCRIWCRPIANIGRIGLENYLRRNSDCRARHVSAILRRNAKSSRARLKFILTINIVNQGEKYES